MELDFSRGYPQIGSKINLVWMPIAWLGDTLMSNPCVTVETWTSGGCFADFKENKQIYY